MHFNYYYPTKFSHFVEFDKSYINAVLGNTLCIETESEGERQGDRWQKHTKVSSPNTLIMDNYLQ